MVFNLLLDTTNKSVSFLFFYLERTTLSRIYLKIIFLLIIKPAKPAGIRRISLLQIFIHMLRLFRHIFKPASSIRARTLSIGLLINCPIPSVHYPCSQNVEKSIKIYQISAELNLLHIILSLFYFYFFMLFSFNQFSIIHAKAIISFLNLFHELLQYQISNSH